MTPDRLAQLQALFPEAFSEGRIDWEQLRAALGADDDAQPERYGLSWAGKRAAIQALHAPCHSTLIPCPEANETGAACEWTSSDRDGVSTAIGGAGNFFIEGDNLEALKLLACPYAGRVKLIYIDPPYNTGGDFIYLDNYTTSLAAYLEQTGQKEPTNGEPPETNGRYHSAWLNMLYPRLALARQLLRDDGAIAVSIGEEELANLRLLLNELFGEENYRNTLLVRRYDKNLNRQFIKRGLLRLNVGAEYILIYARSPACTLNPVYRPAPAQRRNNGYWKGFWNAADRPTMRYELLGATPPSGQWKWKRAVALEAVANYVEYQQRHAARLSLEDYWEQTGRQLKFIRRNPDGKGKNAGVEHWVPPSSSILRTSNWTDLLASGTLADLGLRFDSPKQVALIKEVVRMCCDSDSLVLDFFAGSGTTAQAVLELNQEDDGNRRFMLVQLPEPTGDPHFPTIAVISKERIRRVIQRQHIQHSAAPAQAGAAFRVFTLADSHLDQSDTTINARTLLPGWTVAGVIYEIALRAGYGLDCRIERVAASDGNTVYRVSDVQRGLSLQICLDETLLEARVPGTPLVSSD